MKTGYGFVLFCGAVAALCAAAPAGRAAGITQRFEDDFTTYMNEEDIVTSPDWIRVQAFTLTGYAGSSASVYEAARDAVQFNSGAAGQSACLHTNESCGDGGFRVETGIMLVNEDKRGGLVFNWTPASDSDTDVSGYLFQYMQIAGADSNLVRLLKYDAADEVTDGLAPELDGSKVTEVMPWIKLEGFADIAEANANTWITLAAESDGDGGFRLDVRQKIHGWSTNITDTGTPLTGGYVGFGTQRGNDPAVEGNAAWTGFRFTRFEVTPAGIRDGYTNSFPIAVYTNGEDIAAKDDWNLVQAMTYQTYESEAFFQEHASGDQGSLRLNGSAVRQAVLLYDQTICANAFRAKVGIEGMNHSRRAGLAFNWQSAVDCEENISGYIFQLVGRHSSGGTNYVRLLKYLAADEAADGQSPEVDGSTVIELLGWTAATTGYTLPEPGTDEWIPITLGVSSDGDGRFLLSVEHGLNAGGARRTWEVNDPGPVLRGGFVGMAVQRGKVNNTNIWQDATENDGNWAAALFDDFILLPPLRGSVIVVR